MAAKASSNGPLRADSFMVKEAGALFSQAIKSANPVSTLSEILNSRNPGYKVVESMWYEISRLEGGVYTAFARDAAQKLGGNYVTTSAGMRFVGVDPEQIGKPEGEDAKQLAFYRGLLDVVGQYLHRTQ